MQLEVSDVEVNKQLLLNKNCCVETQIKEETEKKRKLQREVKLFNIGQKSMEK